MGRWLKLLLAAALCAAAPAAADPWVGPGDARLRTDVELLAAYGFVRGPIDAWPLPWAQIRRGLARADEARTLPPEVRAAADRIARLADLADDSTHFEVRTSVTNDAALVRTFDHVARNRGDASVLASHDLGPVHVSWGGSWQSDGSAREPATRHGNGFAPDGSYVSVRLFNNWALYGGWIDTWWGAGEDGALLFSTSARPFRRIGLRRLEPFNIDAPVLRWLGPITFDAFVGTATEQRDFDDPMIIGMRLAMQPAPRFEIAFNRGLMLCGKGRPCGLRTIGDALVGLGDLDNTGSANEPGNQLAGFDFSYRQPVGRGGQVLKFYFATVAEDEAKILIEQFGQQFGASLMSPVGHDGALLDAGVEYTDTQASKFLGKLIGGRTWPGSMYNHFLYTDGWTYGRRPLGYSLDGDAQVWTLHAALTDRRNRRWNVAARHMLLNMNDVPRYRISQNREMVLQLEAGVNWPTAFGDVKATTRLQRNAPNTPGWTPTLVQLELGLLSRF